MREAIQTDLKCNKGGLIMNRITLNQLGSMLVMFLIGSSPLFLLASDAGRDAWLAVMLGMLGGALLLWAVNLAVYRKAPGLNLIEIWLKYLGKPIGYTAGISYVIYFCYKAIRNVREFGDLMMMYLLPQTPIWAIMFIICAMAAYTVLSGVDVLFRMAEFVLPYVLGIYVLLFLLITLSGLIHFENVAPILDEGWKPLLKAAFPGLISFPFGELILFLMFWKYTDDEAGMVRMTMKCYLFSGLFISATNLLLYAGLGTMAKLITVPLMELASLIGVANFFERIDPLVAILLFTGVFFKLAAYYMGAVLGLQQLFNRLGRHAVWIAGSAIFGGSFLFKSYMEQVTVGFKYNLKLHFPIFQIVLPLALLGAVIVKQRWMKRGGK
jgi:spore germination protein KB